LKRKSILRKRKKWIMQKRAGTREEKFSENRGVPGGKQK